ncbi:MAG TPA: hypothetical protein VM492_15370 [Sumerlaeia bacterium]|nr:hypothetical protein [Sumerlaeia bacterium]
MKKSLLVTAILFIAVALAASAAFCNSRSDDLLGVAVSPQLLIRDVPQSGRVTVHTAIPLCTVDRTSLALNGIPAQGSFADSCGNLVALFSETAVEAIVAPPTATLTLTGVSLLTGEEFSGSDTVRVR